jgi:uncharacterized protein
VSRQERNLELMRNGLGSFSRGALDESLQYLHPEIEWHLAFRLPDLPLQKDVYRGHEEVKALWTQFRSAWDEMRIDLEEVLHVDDERMVARTRFRGRGSVSGAEVDQVVFYAFRVREGLLVYCRPFDDEAAARGDLGLPNDA